LLMGDFVFHDYADQGNAVFCGVTGGVVNELI
jgi:hypothetical protein